MALGDANSSIPSPEDLAQLMKLVPNLKALHPATQFQVYREFIPRKSVVELTVFLREPEKEKQRIDAEFAEGLTEDDLTLENVKITYWGSAVRLQ